MEIIDNKAVAFRTRNPDKYRAVIPKSLVEAIPGGHRVVVYWGLDEMRVLKNMGVKNVPSPIERNYGWPGRYKPMAHQKVTAGFSTLHRRAFVFNDPGTAKTISVLWAADYLMSRGDVRRVLVICPLSIMHSAWMGDLNKSVIHRSAVVAHHSKASRRIECIQGDYEIVIINYDGVALVADEIVSNGKFDLVIVDECFVAGTLVATPDGPRPIQQLAAGDKVLTSNGVMRIKKLVRNTATQLVEVVLGNGKTIRCTPDHPFFTDVGWVCARNLAGRRLVSGTEVSRLRAGIPPANNANALGFGESPTDGADLLKILRTEEVAPTESGKELLRRHAARTARGAARPEDASTPRKAIGDSEGKRASPADTRRERNRDDESRTTDFRGLACGLGMELPRSVGEAAARLSYELQARLCVAAPAGRTGGGREQPYGSSPPAAGSQEGTEAGGAWVVSVSHIECPSGEAVYNIEVAGTPNYLVEDNWIVHNCNAYANHTTRRWKALAKILTPDTFLWMMTGTPAAQSPLHAYGLARLVNPSAVPRYANAWRDKVMTKVSTFKWIPKPNAKDIVFDVLQPAIRFSKAQCLDLPPVLKTTREVPLTPQQLKYYNLLKHDMLAVAAGETIAAVNKAALVNKLLQVSAGVAYTENGEVIEFDCTPRLNLLLEILEETSRKVIIFAMHRATIDMIHAFLNKNGYATEVINGSVSATKRGDIINRFQYTDSPRVLVMQPQATAHGITLTAADTVVFYGPIPSVEQYTQCIARADRQGQTSASVTVVHIQSSPVEKKMFDAMESRVTDAALLTQLFDAEMEGTKKA